MRFDDLVDVVKDDEIFQNNSNNAQMPVEDRVGHGYRKTRGYLVMGVTGTGTVVDFGTPQHTAYLYRSVTGIHG